MIKPLTSLRFFFATMVFLSHITFVQTDQSWYNWLQRNIFFEGYLGVSFFFILSGFILAFNYQDTLSLSKVKLKSFYIARIARIFPLHLLAIVCILPILIIKNILPVKILFINLFLVQSFIPIQKVYYSINPPSWSISNEMFFYLLFPFYIYLFNKFKNLFLYFLVIIPILLFITFQFIPMDEREYFFYVNPVTRSLDFILGIALLPIYKKLKKITADWSVSNFSTLEVVACTVFLIFFVIHNAIDRSYRFSIYYWIPMVFCILVFSLKNGLVSKFLSKPILVFLGEISFSVYMLHFVVLYYAMWLKEDIFKDINDILYAFIIFILVVFLSVLSYNYFELPFNKMIRKKFARSSQLK